MDEKEIAKKKEAASTKKMKSTQKPKWKRRVTFDSSAENMGNLTITQKVRVKKQKIKCMINVTNICQIKEKPIKSDVQKSNTTGDRIVPHCLRKRCERIITLKIKQHPQEKAKVKEYPKESNFSKGKKRAHTNNSEESLKSSKRFKSGDKHVSYEDISSDSLDFDDKLDSLYVDNKLDTLIIRTKARERLSEATKAALPKPLYTSTPLREDDYEDIDSSSAIMDVSINSQDTLILEPKLELLSPQNLKEHCFASCELNLDPLKACSSSDFYQFSHINENTPESLVISVDPFPASNGWEVFSQSDANQVFLDINSLSPKNTIKPKEPAVSCKQEHNQVSQEFLDNCVLSLKNVEEVSCITPCNQGSEDIIADYKTNVNQLFVDNKTESFPSNSKNTTHSSKLKSHSDLEVNKRNAVKINPTNLSRSGKKSNSQTLSSINLLSSENENNALCINVPFKKEPTIETVEDNSEDTKADSGIYFNQISIHDKNRILSAIDSRKQDSDYVTADSESDVKNVDLDKSVACKEPVIACSQISRKNTKDSLNNNILFSTNSAVSNESAFRKNDSEEVKHNNISGINLVEPLVVQCVNLINALSPNKLKICEERFIVNRLKQHGSVNRKKVSENIKTYFGNDVNQNSVYICANYPKASATSKEPAMDRVNHNSSSSDVKDEISSDVDQNLLDYKSLSPKYSETSEAYVQTSGDLHSVDMKTSNESAGNQVSLEKSPLLSKNAEIPVEPAVVVVYMAQNAEEPIFSIDHYFKNSTVSRLENNSDEHEKPTEPSFEQNPKEPSAPSLEQSTQESPEPSLEQNSRELCEPSVKQNSIETSELGLEQNSKELFEPIFERNSKEPSEPNLEQVSQKNWDRSSVGSFEHHYEEPAIDNIAQIVKETAFANLKQTSENITQDSINNVIQVDFEENPISHEHNVTEKFIKNVTSLKYNSKIILPAAVVITEESTVIDLDSDFEEANTQQDSEAFEFEVNQAALEIKTGFNERLTASSKQSLDGKVAGSGRNRKTSSDNTLARDNSMPRNYTMTNRVLNSKKNKNIDDKPECIPTGSKKPPIQNIKHKPETSSTTEHLRSLSSTNCICTHNNPRDNSMPRNYTMTNSVLNSKKNKNIDDKPERIPTGSKKPPVQNIKHKHETLSTTEHLRSLSSTNCICTHNNPRDNSMPRNYTMTNSVLNSKKNKNIHDKPKCIPTGSKKTPIQKIQHKPETSSTNLICTHNNPNQQYLDRAMENQISALNQALSHIHSVTNQYRPANLYGQQPFGTTYPYMLPVPSQFYVRTNSPSLTYPENGNSRTNNYKHQYQSHAHKRNNNEYSANRPYRNRPYYHRPNLQAIQNTTHRTTGSIATPHARVNSESNSVKLPRLLSVKYEPNMIKQETTDYSCNTERNNIIVKRENVSPETNSFVANKSGMNDNLIRFIKTEPLD